MKHTIYLLIALTYLVSCDCNQNVRGTVFDSVTKEPIGNVEIYNKKKSGSTTQTDEKGYFELFNISGGLTCPPMTIIIEHEGYNTIETTIKSGGEKEIFLEKKITSQNDTLTYKQAMKNIRDVFEGYKINEESVESEDNKITMTRSLNSLQSVTDKNDLELLINIWNYYDPTDYSCRGEIYKILLQNKTISINAVKDRLKHKMSWESDDLSGTEFNSLLEQLENEK